MKVTVWICRPESNQHREIVFLSDKWGCLKALRSSQGEANTASHEDGDHISPGPSSGAPSQVPPLLQARAHAALARRVLRSTAGSLLPGPASCSPGLHEQTTDIRSAHPVQLWASGSEMQ